ncbi:hypothetical protein AB0F81_33160 [Actinoplanes sp. NPDC024001]|uniref:hypothetical protein n=1 Tax=Actinoplanes sp. NPDC024001 TaxID=3154598 RepID=UPI00340FDD5D
MITHRRWLPVVAVLALLGGCTSSPTDGMTKEEVVDAYVQAIQDGDRVRLVELNDPRLDRHAPIDVRIAAVGDREWSGSRITWVEHPVTGQFDSARITATGPDGEPISDQVHVTLGDDGSWYLSLGERTPQPGDPEPASTVRSHQ